MTGQGNTHRSHYLIVLQGPVNEEGRLLLHPLGDGVGHSVVGLGAPGTALHAVFIIHVLLSCPETQEVENQAEEFWYMCFYFIPFKTKINVRPNKAAVSTVYLSPTIYLRGN